MLLAGSDVEPEFPGLDFDCEVADGRDGFGDEDGDGDHNNSNQPLSAATCVCILLIIIKFIVDCELSCILKT